MPFGQAPSFIHVRLKTLLSSCLEEKLQCWSPWFDYEAEHLLQEGRGDHRGGVRPRGLFRHPGCRRRIHGSLPRILVLRFRGRDQGLDEREKAERIDD